MYPVAEMASHARSLAVDGKGQTETIKMGLQIFSGCAFAALAFYVAMRNVEPAKKSENIDLHPAAPSLRRSRAVCGTIFLVLQFLSAYRAG